MAVIQVKYMHVDVYEEHESPFRFHTKTDYQVYSEYVNPTTYNVHVRSLIGTMDGKDEIWVLIVRKDHPSVPSELAKVLLTNGNGSGILLRVIKDDDEIEPDLERGPMIPFPRRNVPWWKGTDDNSLHQLSRDAFNLCMNSDIVVLPTSLFAIGVANGTCYYYHEGDGIRGREYGNIRAPIHHILDVILYDDLDIHRPLYFVISSTDGYLENVPWSPHRTCERRIKEDECLGHYLPPPPPTENEPSYPVYHSQRWVLAQSSHVGLPNVLDIPDRHYFYHNLYHPFRSFHCGISWTEKIPKIIYAGQARDSPYNFIDVSMQSMGIAPRHYLKTVLAPQFSDFLVIGQGAESTDAWLDRRDMIHYQYILDVDGAASTWDATAWKLNSGSVIIKPKSVWKQWFYHEYLPGIHYVEIANDFSDLSEKYAWCRAHPDECQRMVQNCLALFQSVYAYHNVIECTKKMVMDHLVWRPSPLHQYIDKIIYINLDKRTDRREQMERQLDAFGLSYERFPAIYHPFGIVGCSQSHQAVYRLAKERGYKNVWILEDDFEFVVSRDTFEQCMMESLESGLLSLSSCDVCMLAYNALETEDISGNSFPSMWMRILSAQTASSYIVWEHYYDTLIELYDTSIPLLEQTQQHWNYANDQVWKILQCQDRWIAPKQRLGKQRDGFSDNAQEYISYDC
jgi:glycosyl transferase family 25